MFTTNVYNHSPLYVPIGSEGAYMSDQCWGQFSTIIGKNMNGEVQATGISLNQSQMNFIIGGSSQLIATVLPDSTTNKVVTWASNAPTVATVNANGLVSALGVGTATITATTTDGSNLSASCIVTVGNPIQTPAPEIIVIADDYAYTFTAIGEGEITFYLNGVETEIPFVIARTAEDQIFRMLAVAHIENQIDGTVTGEYLVPAFVAPEPIYLNKFYIDDMEAFHGDTIVIPVKMINEASTISFQTDIFLPEGLELL